jgi:hypothetical protein
MRLAIAWLLAFLMPLSAFASAMAVCQQHGAAGHAHAHAGQQAGQQAGQLVQAHATQGVPVHAMHASPGHVDHAVQVTATPFSSAATASSADTCVACIAGCCSVTAPVAAVHVIVAASLNTPPPVSADPWQVGDRSSVLERPPSILLG